MDNPLDVLEALGKYADGTVDSFDATTITDTAAKPQTVRRKSDWLRIDDFDAFESRAMSLLGKNNRADIVDFIGCAANTYYRGIHTNTIKLGWLAKFVWFYSINPYYLVYGSKYKKYLCESDVPQLNRV